MIDSGESVWKAPDSTLSAKEEIAQHFQPRPWRRLAITMLAPIVYFALTRIPIPTLDARTLDLLRAMPSYDPASTSICALGIIPVISAFYVVEVVALLVPRWNRLRIGGPEGRRKLTMAIHLLTLLFVVIQSWLIGTELAAIAGDPSLVPVTIACHLAVTGLLIALAQLIDRSGLGGGYAVLLGAAAVPVMYGLFWSGWEAVRRNLLSALHVSSILALVGAVVAVTAYLLRLGRTRTPGLVLRVPASGILPLGIASALLSAFESLQPTEPGYWLAYLSFALLLAPLLSWLFNRPTLVGDAIAHVTGEDREQLWEAARSQLGAVTAVTASFIGGLVLVSFFLGWLVSGALFVDVALVVVLTALIMDLVGEWRFRRSFPGAVAVWPLHRVYSVGPALLALERAGIPAHARSLKQRTLYQFFGPEVPIEVLVPEEKREEARTVLEGALI